MREGVTSERNYTEQRGPFGRTKPLGGTAELLGAAAGQQRQQQGADMQRALSSRGEMSAREKINFMRSMDELQSPQSRCATPTSRAFAPESRRCAAGPTRSTNGLNRSSAVRGEALQKQQQLQQRGGSRTARPESSMAAGSSSRMARHASARYFAEPDEFRSSRRAPGMGEPSIAFAAARGCDRESGSVMKATKREQLDAKRMSSDEWKPSRYADFGSRGKEASSRERDFSCDSTRESYSVAVSEFDDLPLGAEWCSF